MASRISTIVLFSVLWLFAVADDVADLALKDDADFVHPLTDLPPASPDVQTSNVFPEHPDKKFTPGEVVKLLLAFSNNGPKGFNVTKILGSLNAPQDFSYYIQNFTAIQYNRVVPPGEQASFLYLFAPDPNLDPREFVLAFTVFYQDLEGEKFSSTYFNGTVDFVEPESQVDSKTFFIYILLAGGASLVFYIIYKTLQGVKTTAKKSGRKVELGTSEKNLVDNEWIPQINLRSQTPPRRPKPKST